MITKEELKALSTLASTLHMEDTLVTLDNATHTVPWSSILDCLSWSEYSEGSLGYNGQSVELITDWLYSFTEIVTPFQTMFC